MQSVSFEAKILHIFSHFEASYRIHPCWISMRGSLQTGYTIQWPQGNTTCNYQFIYRNGSKLSEKAYFFVVPQFWPRLITPHYWRIPFGWSFFSAKHKYLDHIDGWESNQSPVLLDKGPLKWGNEASLQRRVLQQPHTGYYSLNYLQGPSITIHLNISSFINPF